MRPFENNEVIAVVPYVDFLTVLRIVRPVVNEPSLFVKADGNVRIET